MQETPWKPNREQVAAAANKTIPDIISTGLEVLFCGINPGLYTAAIGHHFGRPGNRFWKVLHMSGFTSRQISPFEEQDLLSHHLGITNVVARATAAATELDRTEFRKGAKVLEAKLGKYQPKALAVLGVQAYRVGFDRPKATVGRQPDRIGETLVWVLPNPSGLQAHYQMPEMARLFGDLRTAVRGE